MATTNPEHVPLGRVTSAPELHHPPLLDIPGPTIHRVKTDVVSGTQHVEVSHLDLLEHPVSWFRGIWHAFLATALFRCWHHILFFTAEAAVITYFAKKDKSFKIDPSMVTVVGTFIGFIISLRTSASFDRYHEGRKYWSQLAHNALQFSRIVWFHVPQNKVVDGQTEAEARARTLVEKRTIINLIEGFAVAVKHHLRGENGVYYEDLYHLVKMLPAYAMESGVLSPMYSYGGFGEKPTFQAFPHPDDTPAHDREITRVGTAHTFKTGELPLPATATHLGSDLKQRKKGASAINLGLKEAVPNEGDAAHLLPARNPPATTIFDFWPFSMFVRYLTDRGRRVSGKKAGKLRAQSMRYGSKTQNVPLEISFYVSSYIRKQQQSSLDGLILAQLLDHSKLMVDAHVGLDRIQTTPIPFSYGVHLWTITVLYLLLLPFQLAQSLKWLTPAASALASFAYCGLLRAGDEIEHPFGYDYNDLNLDHFTKHVIRKELRALTAMPVKDPSDWMFSGDNDRVFDDPSNARLHPTEKTKLKYPGLYDHTAELRRTPATWVQAGETQIMRALALTGGVDASMFKATKEVPDLISPVPRSPPSPSPSPSPTPGLQQAPTSLSVVSPSRQSSDRRVVHDFA